MNIFKRLCARRGLFIASVWGAILLLTGCVSPEERTFGNLAAQERECRTTKTMGSKMRQSVCMTKEEWAAVDAYETERIAAEEQTSALLRQMEEYRSQYPAPTDGTYNPYPPGL